MGKTKVNNEISERFRKRFNELIGDNTQANIGKNIGDISQQVINDYANGKKTPQIENLIKIAKYYNVSTDYLLGLSEAKRTDSTYIESLLKQIEDMRDKQKEMLKILTEE